MAEVMLRAVVDRTEAMQMLKCLCGQLSPYCPTEKSGAIGHKGQTCDPLDQRLDVRAAHLDECPGKPLGLMRIHPKVRLAILERSEHIAIDNSVGPKRISFTTFDPRQTQSTDRLVEIHELAVIERVGVRDSPKQREPVGYEQFVRKCPESLAVWAARPKKLRHVSMLRTRCGRRGSDSRTQAHLGAIGRQRGRAQRDHFNAPRRRATSWSDSQGSPT